MEVIICPHAETAAQMVVSQMARELVGRPTLALGLATGRTMEAVYQRLVQCHHESQLDFSRCCTFNLDEYVGLPATDANSYRYFMQSRLFDRVNLVPDRCHLPNSTAEDLPAECARYEQLIAAQGGIDLQLLGIGLNGHLGFNEPPSSFDSRTRVISFLLPGCAGRSGGQPA